MTEKELDMAKYQVRTDLIVESKAMHYSSIKEEKESGIITYKKEIHGIKIETVELSKKSEEKLGKKAGLYTTIYAKGIIEQDTELQIATEKALAVQLRDFIDELKIDKMAVCLVVGLGNVNITPDAIGPLVIEDILITKHLFELQPEMMEEGFRPVCAFIPGVMGMTGVETSDIIIGIVEKIKPDFIVVIDALAARSIGRVNTTIQITDTGIHPGSGVGNRRKEISKETIGVPVISIGVPTVVDAVTITSDTIDLMLKNLGREWQEKDRKYQALVVQNSACGKGVPPKMEHMPNEKQRNVLLGLVGNLSEEEKRQLIYEVLTPIGQNFMVTPKEVDQAVKDVANILANGLNDALHEKITQENIAGYSK